jgi:hypothetical protein
MTNVLKFRTYQNGRFSYWGFGDDGHGLHFAGLPDDNLEPLTFAEKLKRTQRFIGLVDREKTEVYEGDILVVNDWGVAGGLLGIAEIIWDEDELGWRFFPNLVEDPYDMRKAISVSKIAGNVFQNQALLNNY